MAKESPDLGSIDVADIKESLLRINGELVNAVFISPLYTCDKMVAKYEINKEWYYMEIRDLWENKDMSSLDVPNEYFDRLFPK